MSKANNRVKGERVIFTDLKLNAACAAQKVLVDAKGFKKENVPTYLMLTVTELSEACEADRKGKHADFRAFRDIYAGALEHAKNIGEECPEDLAYKVSFENSIKDTIEDEIADAFLRLMHFCGEYGIDIERHIQAKAAYNQLRPAKHGKAY